MIKAKSPLDKYNLDNMKEPTQDEAVINHFSSNVAKRILINAGDNREQRRSSMNHGSHSCFTKNSSGPGMFKKKKEQRDDYHKATIHAKYKYNLELEKIKEKTMEKVTKLVKEKAKKKAVVTEKG